MTNLVEMKRPVERIRWHEGLRRANTMYPFNTIR